MADTPILSIEEFDAALDAFDDAAFACGEWSSDSDGEFEAIANNASDSRAAVHDAYAELLHAHEQIVQRSAQEADRAQALVFEKEIEIHRLHETICELREGAVR
jgi:hypothetical protein